MNTRTLGMLAMICSPFLAFDYVLNAFLPNHFKTSLSGILSLVYMTGWFFSIVALYRMQAMGGSRAGRIVFQIQMLFLTLGECWNIYAIVDPTASTFLYYTLDLFWPLSNIFMLATGVVVFRAKQLDGWRRFVPFAVGLWLPLTLVLLPLAFGRNDITTFISGAYSATAWFMLGYVVFTAPRQEALSDAFFKRSSTVVVKKKTAASL